MSPAAVAPYPEYWSEKKDSKGRIFYSNHRTRTTTWERPVPSEPSSPNDDPPPYTPPAKETQHHRWRMQNSPSDFTCTFTPMFAVCSPSFTLSVAAVVSWVVWALAVSISVDDQWFENVDDFSAGDDLIRDGCRDNELSDDFCDLYVVFTALQFMAVSVVSLSMLLLVVALFRPGAGRFFSTCSLLIAGATLMAVFALFQLLAFVSVGIIGKTEKGFGAHTTATEDPEIGPTFKAAVAAVLLAVVQAGAVLVFAPGSGDGPFYEFAQNCRGINSRSTPDSGGSMAQPPRPIARTPSRSASPDSRSPAMTPPLQITVPSPDFSPDLDVKSSVVRSSAVSRADRPEVESPAVHTAVVSWADPLEVPSPTARFSVAFNTVRLPEETKTVEPAVDTPPVRPPVVAPTVQPPPWSPAVEAVVASPAVQSPEATPAVQPVVASKAVESPAASPDVQPSVTSAAVESPLPVSAVEATVAVQSPVASPAVQPVATGAAVESPVLTSAVEPPAVASPGVESTATTHE